MEEPLETKRCGLCGKDIEAAKFRMHDIGCARQNYKCKDCGACVPKAEKEEHEEEEHAIITCEHCGFSAAKHKYGEHAEKCTQKPRACEFCSKTVSFLEYNDHYNLCGSKTYKCETCGDFVKLMDKQTHIQSKACAKVLERKKREEDAEQAKRLGDFQKEREREIERNKEREAKRAAEEAEAQRKREERDRQYEAMHGGFEDSEFAEQPHKFPPANAPKRGAVMTNNQRQEHPVINTRSNQPNQPSSMAPVPKSYMARGKERQASRGKEEAKLPGPVVNNRSKPTQPMSRSGLPAKAGASRPVLSGGLADAPGMRQAGKNEANRSKPVSTQQQPISSYNAGAVSSQIKSNSRAQANPARAGGQIAPSRAPVASSSKSKPIERAQPARQNNQDQGALDDYDAMIFNQFMEDDESERLAQQLQEEMYGGGGAGASGFGDQAQQPMDGGGAGVRAADEGQYGQLIGGADDYAPRQRRSRHTAQQQEQVPDQVMHDDWGGMGGGHQQHAGYEQQQQHVAGAEEDEQALMNRIIEESLQNAHSQNAHGGGDEDAELQRILEMSKNMM